MLRSNHSLLIIVAYVLRCLLGPCASARRNVEDPVTFLFLGRVGRVIFECDLSGKMDIGQLGASL